MRLANFGIINPNLPIHCITFMGLQRRLNGVYVLESVKVTVYALRCTQIGATRRLSDYPLRGADHPSDIGQESGCGLGFVVEFSFTRQPRHQQQLLSATPSRRFHFIRLNL